MHVSIEASVTATQRGVLARCEALRLTGGGKQDDEAIESLRRSVLAWCKGLKRLDKLDDALRRRGIRWTPDDGPLVVEIRVAGATEAGRG